MGVTNGGPAAAKPKISSQLHLLSDPLAPVRALTIHHPGVSSTNPPTLSYSNSTGSDHSLIRLDFGGSSPADSASGGSGGSPVGERSSKGNGGGIPRVKGAGLNPKSRKSRSFSSRGDANYQLFTIDLSGPPPAQQHKRSLGNVNGTLDFPHIKLSDPPSTDPNSTLDIPHARLSHSNSSPARPRRKEPISAAVDLHNRINHSFSVPPDQPPELPPLNSASYPPPKVPTSNRKASSRSLHGVFHSRLSGPLGSLQPVTNTSSATSNSHKSSRSRKKRHSAIAFFSSQARDKENLQQEHQVDTPPNFPSMLHQLAWMCRRHNNTSLDPPPADLVLNGGLSNSDSSLCPAGVDGPVGLGAQGGAFDMREESDLGRARKVSHALRALAGRLSFSLGKPEHHYPPPDVSPPHPQTPPPLASRVSAASTSSSSSNAGKRSQIECH